MKQQIDLLEGPILPSLTKLAIPIMATSLVQMAYNMIDMIWIGRISSDAVAAVGAAGMYMWLSNGLATLAKMGGQVKVGHALGAKQNEEAVSFAQSSIQLGIFFGILFSCNYHRTCRKHYIRSGIYFRNWDFPFHGGYGCCHCNRYRTGSRNACLPHCSCKRRTDF